MADMLSETEALAELLRSHRGADVASLDLRQMGSWTDFFVIATASSAAHLDGLERHVGEFCRAGGIEILRRSRRPRAAQTQRGAGPGAPDEWRIIDLGHIVIHLMSARARAFYDLERLHSIGPAIG